MHMEKIGEAFCNSLQREFMSLLSVANLEFTAMKSQKKIHV